ncbi:MAG TPA: succinylglutamate desuccinylase/aspartoacylase family protein [Petrotogaceae bacterium]|nr:succinylglutamate desuccinylase/aspartoacylase family protein [Petrotogaceae bacterium]
MKNIVLMMFIVIISVSILAVPFYADVRPGYGLTEEKWLSDYFSGLKDTWGDTKVYVLRGKEPGASALLLGGTHGNEISGIMAAMMYVERANVQKGTLYVIVRANNSNATYHEKLVAGTPDWVEFETQSGKRVVSYGSRRTNPLHQGNDPEKYRYPGTELGFEGAEARNLNRVHPGNPDGTLTEKISYGIFELIRKENIDMVLDMHEAGTKSRLAYTLVCNPKNIDMGAMVMLDLEQHDLGFKLEQSSKEFRGLSHKEIGDQTDAIAFLSETPNPGQDYGDYDGWSRQGLADVVNDAQYPLSHRVAVQVETFRLLCDYLPMFYEKEIIIQNIPSYDEISDNLFGFYN